MTDKLDDAALAAIKAAHDQCEVALEKCPYPPDADLGLAHEHRAALLAEVERLRAELVEDQGVIAVWRRRTGEAEADAAALRMEVADLIGRGAAQHEAVEAAQADAAALRKERDAAELMSLALKAGLADVAMIAHNGGLAGLSEEEAMTAIRRLTLRAWDTSGSAQEIERRVRAALARAGGGA